MKGFGGLDRALSSTVHFTSRADYLEDLPRRLAELSIARFSLGYVDFCNEKSAQSTLRRFGEVLDLPHRPFESNVLMQTLDGLMYLSERSAGFVTMIDNGQEWLSTASREFFDFIEMFLTQTDNWLGKGKPCTLLVQIESDPRIKDAFSNVSAHVR